MNLLNRYHAWASTWSRSQVLFLACFALVMLLLLFWVAAKHDEMAGIAQFWRQQYEMKP